MESKFELEALFDAVIVEPLEEEETTYGSIVVPDLGKDRNEHGKVVAVGPGRHVAGVGYVETEIKVGDTVILPTMGFTKLEHKGKDYYIGQENQILARINPTTSIEEVLKETMEDNKEEIEKKIEIQKILNK
jgi:chaperonin GroES